MTGRDLIAASLRKIGALAAGEPLQAQEATDGLAEINRMLSSWSTDGLLIYTKVRETLTLTPGVGGYTLGVLGDLSTARPVQIVHAAIRDESGSEPIERPVRILSLAQYQAISAKDVQRDYPHALYADGGYPQQTLRLYPVPSAAHKLVLWSEKPLTEVTLDGELSFPPGYEDAIVYNGALRLAPEYGKQVDAMVLKGAEEGIARIKRANYRPGYLEIHDIPAGGGYSGKGAGIAILAGGV